jgi:hypothetical protein
LEEIFNQFGEWLKSLLIPVIMDTLSHTFDMVNDKVGEVATQVGQTPADFQPGVFSMIRTHLRECHHADRWNYPDIYRLL